MIEYIGEGKFKYLDLDVLLYVFSRVSSIAKDI